MLLARRRFSNVLRIADEPMAAQHEAGADERLAFLAQDRAEHATNDLPAEQQMPAAMLGKSTLDKHGQSDANTVVLHELRARHAAQHFPRLAEQALAAHGFDDIGVACGEPFEALAQKRAEANAKLYAFFEHFLGTRQAPR